MNLPSIMCLTKTTHYDRFDPELGQSCQPIKNFKPQICNKIKQLHLNIVNIFNNNAYMFCK